MKNSSSQFRVQIILVVWVLFFPAMCFANGYDDALKHVLKAEAFLEKKDYKEALRELNEAANWNSGYGYYAYIRYLSGKAHSALGHTEVSKNHFLEALQEAPNVNYRFVDPKYKVPEDEIRAFLEKSPDGPKLPKKKTKPIPEYYFNEAGKGVEIYSNIIFEFGNKHSRPCEFSPNPALLHSILTPDGKTIKNPVSIKQSQVEKQLLPFCKNLMNYQIYAHGKGWIERITPKEFMVQAEPSFCGDEDKNFRILTKGEKLKGDPLFFTTREVKSKSNGFRSSQSLHVGNGSLNKMFPDRKFELPGTIGKMEEVKVYSYPSEKGNQSLVIVTTRGDASGEGGWSGLFMVDDKNVKNLTEVFDSEYCGPNKLVLEGLLDYDGDGDMDILINSNRSMILLIRNSLGFRTVSWGLKPCTC